MTQASWGQLHVAEGAAAAPLDYMSCGLVCQVHPQLTHHLPSPCIPDIL